MRQDVVERVMREVQKLVFSCAVGRNDAYMFPKSEIISFGVDHGRTAMWYVVDPYNAEHPVACAFLITYDHTALEPEWRVYHGSVYHPDLQQHLHLFQRASLADVHPFTFGGRLIRPS